MAISIADIMEAAHATAVKKGWYAIGMRRTGAKREFTEDDGSVWEEQDIVSEPVSRNTGEVLALMHSELSEALEEWRSGQSLTDIRYGEGGKPEGFGVELADVIIRICDTAQQLGVPLERCLVEKLAFNESRPYRHGGKVA